jgi:ATP-dependent DNA helicase RecG
VRAPTDAPPASAPGTELSFRELDAISLERLNGIGPKRLSGLAELGLSSVLDLLMHYPRRYVDRSAQGTIRDLEVGASGMITGTVLGVSSRQLRGRRSMAEVRVSDGTGVLNLTFFNQPWRTRQLSEGQEIVVFGKMDEFRGRKQMTSPIVDLLGDQTGKIVAVYPQSEKARVTSGELSGWVAEALRRCATRGIADPLTPADLAELGLCGRSDALRAIHAPESMAEMVRARARLVFDELLRIQLVLVDRKRQLALSTAGCVQPIDSGRLVERFRDRLPFELTAAQSRAIGEVSRDMAASVPMHRLLQGDVGAGKTVVATAAMLQAVQAQNQAAMMAPTEVLAEQHYAGVAALVADLELDAPEALLATRPVRVGLFTSKMGAAERRSALADLAAGHVDIAVGTHALIQDKVGFLRLGIAVVDEQHRFGVDQRAALRTPNADGSTPDLLVMTATPIPRSAAMTVYGDLDVSVLDELPPGRTPIETTWARTEADVDQAWDLVRSEVSQGRQAYVVCPLIEESEKMEAASAESTFEELSAGQLAGLRLALLHGRLPSDEKQRIMSEFREGKIDVIVATTVIEVGVDVPNATVMVVLAADRFGIAQLHQLRGRVGRGAHASYCVLVSDTETEIGRARLQALVDSTDGFELAEIDLDLRGEGSIFGERQTGRSDLRLASLRRDRTTLVTARRWAERLVTQGEGLGGLPEFADEIETLLSEDNTEYLAKG